MKPPTTSGWKAAKRAKDTMVEAEREDDEAVSAEEFDGLSLFVLGL